jgi:hypothetical protein
VAAAATSVTIINHTNGKLRAEVDSLKRRLADAGQQTVEMDRLRSKLEVDTTELTRLRNERSELLRLRSQVGDLRRQLADVSSQVKGLSEATPALWRLGERRAPSDLRNTGQGTPQSAFETLLWTAQNLPDKFAAMIRPDPAIGKGWERWDEMGPGMAAALAAQVGKAAAVWIDDARNMEVLTDGQSSGPLTVLDLKLEPQPGTSLTQTNLSMAFSLAGTNWVPVILKDMRAIEPPSQNPDSQSSP